MDLMRSFLNSSIGSFAISVGGYTTSVFAAVSNEFTLTVFGVAIGTAAGWWAIYRAMQEPLEGRLRQQRDEARVEADEYRRLLTAERSDLAKARVHIAELEEESGEKQSHA